MNHGQRFRVLGVGIATLDIVNEVDGYPPEDSEVRALSQERRRGGNAANTLTVLSGLDHHCTLAATLANEPDGRLIRDDLERHGIDLTPVSWIAGGKVPTSYITLNRRNGSRSIVHYRDLPEYDFARFSAIDLQPFDWVHFEGRNVAETGRMLQRLRTLRPGLRCSLEVEKPRAGIEALFAAPDLLLLSRHYSEACGQAQPEEALAHARRLGAGGLVACSWGSEGAWIGEAGTEPFRVPAFPLPAVVDTLGAGDTFNAGMIHALLHGQSVAEAALFAGRLAGHKCGRKGFDGLDAGG